MEGNSEYAVARRANIKRNNIELAKLKLKSLSSLPKTSRKKRGSTRAVSKAPQGPRRRSKRTRDIEPAYTGEKIDRSMDMEDEDTNHTIRTKKKKRKKKMAAAEILAKQKVWLQEKREFLVSQYSNSTNGDKSTTDSWHKIAVSKWGKLVTLASCVDWERYVLSRTSTPSVPTKKFGILQEEFQHCPWRLLICCVLMSRVSSEAVKTLAISSFFAKYPTPSDVLDVTFNPTSAFEILRPLGLFENRLKAVVEISSKFLTMPEFAVGMDKQIKIYGIGEFGCDSFSIFIRGEGRNLYPKDRTLAAYCRWSRELN